MKKLLFVVLAVSSLFLPSAEAAPKKGESYPRVYGKITAINLDAKSLTVHNKRQNKDTDFVWDDSTKISLKKNAIPADQLAVGQNLIVGYLADGDTNRAKKITVRPAAKKKKGQLTLLE